MADIVVETVDLTKIYGNAVEVRALDGVNLRVGRGELVAVMGPSGSGKSTLLNMIGALDRPTSGRVIVDGQDLTTVKDLDRFRARMVGFVFQLHNLLPTLNAVENVEVPMQGQSISAHGRRQRAEELLHLVGLGDRLHHLPNALSGGQRQRVAIARALANEPAILLADEPTGDLDSQSGEDVMNLLVELNRNQGMTVIVVTHDRQVALRTGRILIMEDGRIVDDHPVADPLTEDLREFAHSRVGQLLINGQSQELSGLGLSTDGHLTDEARKLRELLESFT
jgi:putative ABC transport system ATP-binding protein